MRFKLAIYNSLLFIILHFCISSNTPDHPKCDGRRPRCVNCADSGAECSYRDESEFPHEAGKLVVEAVRILNSLPAEAAARTLQRLRGEANAPTIMSTLRREISSGGWQNGGDDDDENLDAAASQTGLPGTDPPLELEVQHPVAYPALTFVSSNTLSSDTGESTDGE